MKGVGSIFELAVIERECVGIEVELENVDNPRVGNSKYWAVVGDGSLRNNGVEFLSRGPTPYDKMAEAMQELSDILNRYPASEASCRTGLHVHINVSDMTPDQVKAMLLLSVLVEPGLIWHCGEDRASNIYSLASSRGDCILNNLQAILNAESNRKFRDEVMRSEGFKYSALNIGAICNKGTLEYRMHRGTKSVKDIEQWTAILISLRRLAIDMGDVEGVLGSLDYIREYVSECGLSPSCITRKSERRGRLLMAPVNRLVGYREDPARNNDDLMAALRRAPVVDELMVADEEEDEEPEEAGNRMNQIGFLRNVSHHIRQSLPPIAFEGDYLDDSGFVSNGDVFMTGMRTTMDMSSALKVTNALRRQQMRLVNHVE